MASSGRYILCHILLVLVYEGFSSDLCRKNAIEIERSRGYTSLSELLNAAINYSVDPCQDFYQFACGKWIGEREETTFTYAETQLQNNREKLRSILEALFVSEEVLSPKSVNAMKNTYKKCLSSDQDWEFKGGPINFVLARLEGFGYFPLMHDYETETDVDLTHLLAYFNKNKTVLSSILPVLTKDAHSTSKLIITFKKSDKYLIGDFGKVEHKRMGELKKSFVELLFKMSSRICIEVRDTCNDTSIRQGIGEVLTFMERISRLAQLNFSDEGKRYHLSELDVNLSSVNWTKFFIMTTPPDMHSYFLADPLVEVPSMRYTKRIDKLLQRTPKRVFTNYVILHYILSWIQYLDDEYRQLMEEFLKDVGLKGFPAKHDFCYLLMSRWYDAAVLSIYGQHFDGRDTEELAERLVRDVMAAFEEGIKENKWMTNEQKKLAISKANRMRVYAAYDDVHFNDTKLDHRHKNLIDLQHLEFLDLVDKYEYMRGVAMIRKLLDYDPAEDFTPYLNSLLPSPNAFYAPLINMLVVPVTWLQVPLFHSAYPISYNFGSTASVIGHELMHGFDGRGMLLDENGKPRKWDGNDWSLEFRKRATCLEKLYSSSLSGGCKKGVGAGEGGKRRGGLDEMRRKEMTY
ncbi:hypothetical protein RB195_017763 [Necator americanus]|uniref:Peptidase family M13 n=1 Tax=Necator americanus TaxID=51031 RepID=A0ABR1C9L9_NECAM